MRVRILLVWLLLIIPGLALSQERIKGFAAYEHEGLLYRLWGDELPRDSTFSVVVFLHGIGQWGNNNKTQIEQESQIIDSLTSYCITASKRCLVVVPQCPYPETWVNLDWKKGTYNSDEVGFSIHLQRVVSLIESLSRQFAVDPSRIYCIGQSMGGYGTWDLLQARPSLFAAAIPVCGAADTSKAQEISSTPVWVFHGEPDPEVPSRGSREIVEKLRELNSEVKYTEYADEFHIVWPRVAREPGLFDWLFDHSRPQSKVKHPQESTTVLSYDVSTQRVYLTGARWKDGMLILADLLGRELLRLDLNKEAIPDDGLSIKTKSPLFYAVVNNNTFERGKVIIKY